MYVGTLRMLVYNIVLDCCRCDYISCIVDNLIAMC